MKTRLLSSVITVQLSIWGLIATVALSCTATPVDDFDPTAELESAVRSADYTIVSSYTGKAVEVYDWAKQDGARVAQWDITGGANQIWRVRSAGNNSYTLVSKNSGKCLDILGWNDADGAHVGQWECNGKDNQKWKIVSKAGAYQIESAWNRKCLDILEWNTSNGADVGIWTCKGAGNQRYKLVISGGVSGPGNGGGDTPTPDAGNDSNDTPPDGSPSGTPESPAKKVIQYLASISGSKTVAGQHNREPNAEPAKWTNAIHGTTGRYPGLWSGDFLFDQESIANRGAMIKEAQAQWKQGALVNIMYHACPPTQGESCGWDGGVLSHLSDAQWNELVTDGASLNRIWKSRLDRIAVHLQDLKTQGVAVLFRPLHEMNQGSFWWGGRKGENGTRKLYQITHDYLTKTKGLDNLVWIWDVQDLSWDFAEYNPGPNYFDVAALDVYGDGYTMDKYKAMLAVAGNKPIAIGECERLPSAAELASQPRWTFFMAWAELVYKNSTQAIKDVYAAPNVVTRDEMPGWQR